MSTQGEQIKLLEKEASKGEETLMQKAMRSAVMNVATGGMAGAFAHTGLGEALSGHGADVTGIHGSQVGDGSVLHHGPDGGGEALERPSAGYMADASRGGSISVEGGSSQVSHIARNLDDAGHFSMRGAEYDVFDYLPGGDIVQLGAGRVDPAQVMTSLAGEGIEHGMMHEAEGLGKKRNASPTHARSAGEEAGTNPVEGPITHQPEGKKKRAPGKGLVDAAEESGMDDETTGAATGAEEGRDTETGRKRRIDPATGQHIPDADENARDLEELMFEHGQRLDTAVGTSSQSTVHTELHAHGRTLEIDTEFEARDRKDVPHEIREAEDHAEKTLHAQGVGNTVETDTPDMRFRSQVHAHLDAMSKDEGISV